MMSRIRVTLPLILALCLVCVACARPQAATPEQIDALARKGDTVALAKQAAAACDPVAAADRQNCYEDYFVKLARSDRVHLALGALATLAADNHDIERDGHSYTHVIGIRAWHTGADVATIFRSCTGLFQSGCYHGVVQAYLADGGKLDSARAVELCDKIAPNEADRWLRFQCVHGLGHGFEMGNNWDLPSALKGCDWLKGSWDRNSCYGGAFMENADASMPSGHHASMHALSAGAPMDSSMHMQKITFKMRDSADALYPCDSVSERYQYACYQLQGGLILTRVRGDFAKATTECDKAPPIPRSQCYLSLGTNASGMSVRNTKQAIAWCSNGDPGYQPFCFVGVAKNFIDVTSKPDDGIEFCKAVSGEGNRMQCFTAVGEEMAVLFATDLEARAKACSSVPTDREADCRRGAELPAKH